ncbi:cryptochrome/photolyase family protein [Rhizosaccharibacter radicis]|uniref:DNA photolyase family protein n=1 Tax=Rhizosaccharibacter radicis TaxID=2782605 RepID=A0ABT1VTZ4_9PROT|nr:DNA photolyase family protein [Acetobacteraceae bacterium KSS12]
MTGHDGKRPARRGRAEAKNDAGSGSGSANSSRATLLWFRQDLRLEDNRALHAAADTSLPVVFLFVLDDGAAGDWKAGGAGRWWLHGSLSSLAASLEARGARLILRRGDATAIVPALAAEIGAGEVHCGLPHEPWMRKLDEQVAAALEKAGRRLVAHRVATTMDLDAVWSKSGTRFGVYSPFARACRAAGAPDAPLSPPRTLACPGPQPSSDALDNWNLLPTRPDWAGGLRNSWQPGEAGAQARLKRFLDGHLDGYGASRDAPGEADGTSMLSPHLHWGELSPNQVWHAAHDSIGGSAGRRAGFETFESELLWHDFSAYVLRHNPALPDRPVRGAFERMEWRRDPAALQAWQQGRTGVPIVDAGMRQLWRIGWMQNRARMITASFLVKHLLLPWQEGERWFWDTLVDADLATNSVSWQWIAGSGIDSQPFFRVFNPVTQSRRYDRNGTYIRRWVPELRELPDRWLHAPWEAPEGVLTEAGITLGQDYPRPLVDLSEGRNRALAAFRRIAGPDKRTTENREQADTDTGTGAARSGKTGRRADDAPAAATGRPGRGKAASPSRSKGSSPSGRRAAAGS